MIVALVDSDVRHYGSTLEGPVDSTIDHTSVFVKINNVEVVTSQDKIDTPSHIYDYDDEGNPLYHEHSDQDIDYLQNSYVKVDGNYLVVVGDKNIVNDTRIDSTNQNFVIIN